MLIKYTAYKYAKNNKWRNIHSGMLLVYKLEINCFSWRCLLLLETQHLKIKKKSDVLVRD